MVPDGLFSEHETDEFDLEPVSPLDRARRRIVSVGYIVRLIRERFAGSISVFLVLSPHLADRVHRAIVPGNSRFAIHIRPLAVNVVERTASVAVFIQSDVESAPTPVPHLPLAQKMSARRSAHRR